VGVRIVIEMDDEGNVFVRCEGNRDLCAFYIETSRMMMNFISMLTKVLRSGAEGD